MRRGPMALALCLFVAMPCASLGDPAVPVETTTVAVSSRQPDQVAHVEWVLQRFAAAELNLPDMTIAFHQTRTGCKNNDGLVRISGRRAVIDECQTDPTDIRWSLAHEFAHAWDYATDELTDAERTRFLDLRHLSAWNRLGDGWAWRGCEQAADIIAWGLALEEAPIPSHVGRVGPQGSDDLRAAYHVLTGSEPLWYE